MTTAYRSDLVGSVYQSEIAKLLAGFPVRMDPSVVSCPKNCRVHYSLLIPEEATEAETAEDQAAVGKALQQQYCPHHPPKIELDLG
jgi:hypothetical protein